MIHQEFDTLPNYETAFFDGKAISPKPGFFLWSNPEPPPAIGTEITLRMNNLGRAVVTGYFAKGSWLGLKTKVINPPKGLSNKDGDCLIEFAFGAEFKLA